MAREVPRSAYERGVVPTDPSGSGVPRQRVRLGSVGGKWVRVSGGLLLRPGVPLLLLLLAAAVVVMVVLALLMVALVVVVVLLLFLLPSNNIATIGTVGTVGTIATIAKIGVAFYHLRGFSTTHDRGAQPRDTTNNTPKPMQSKTTESHPRYDTVETPPSDS